MSPGKLSGGAFGSVIEGSSILVIEPGILDRRPSSPESAAVTSEVFAEILPPREIDAFVRPWSPKILDVITFGFSASTKVFYNKGIPSFLIFTIKI